MGPRLVIGIDGGGSRSEARVWDDGRELLRAAGGPLNPNHAGVEGSRASLVELISRLRIEKTGAGRSLSVDAACVGLSGVSHPASRGIVQAAFRTADVSVAGPTILVSDAELVLEAAFGPAAPSGVALIAGTGSIALARDRSGSIVRAGGRGPADGDQGGGHWIGLRARELVRPVARAAGAERPADLAREVVRRARSGDAAAAAILVQAGKELAILVREASASARLGTAFEVRASGGLALNAPEILRAVADELRRDHPAASMGPVVAEPILGALGLAGRA